MGPKSSRFTVYPLVPIAGGQHSISDETLIYIWKRIEEEGKIEQLFYDGSVTNIQEWLNFIKQPGMFPIIVWDNINNQIVHILWLKDAFDCSAWIHHCAVGNYRRGVWEASLEHWQRFDSLKLLLGLTPKTNKKAVKILKGICKFTIVGEIPFVCNMHYEGKRVPGILSYFDITEKVRHEAAHKTGGLSWAEEAKVAAAPQ
jgi:hypothetical protein